MHESTLVFIPFHTNIGRFIRSGKNVFVNHACTSLDMGGISVEDEVLLGPKVHLITENHPLDPADRKAIIAKPIVLKRNAWIGAAATILPGVTIGENSVSRSCRVTFSVHGVPRQHRCPDATLLPR